MIRVTIEMVPFGIGHPRHMATIEIANDRIETIESQGRKGGYVGRFSRISQKGKQPDEKGGPGWYDRRGRVTGIHRNQSGAVYRIVHGVLQDWLERAGDSRQMARDEE
jgi:hypothetical protein